jgi:hypothetical protein
MSEPIVFRRTTGSRVLSALTCALMGLLLISFAVGGSPAPRLSWALVTFFLVIAAWLSIANFGDRIVVSSEGVRVVNLYLAPIGFPPRVLAWRDVDGLREHRKRALFLYPKKGRALVLDYVHHYEELVRLVQTRTGISLPPRKDDPRDGSQMEPHP